MDAPHQTICVALVESGHESVEEPWRLWLTPQAANELTADLRWATGFYPVAEARALAVTDDVPSKQSAKLSTRNVRA